MTYIRKVRPLLEDALLQFSAHHCTFIFHYSFDRRLQCFRIGPLKLVPPASFHQVFSSKKVQDKKNPLCGLWLTTRNHYEVYLPQVRKSKNKTSPWFMACFQSLRRVAIRIQHGVLGLRHSLLQRVPQGEEFLPASQTSSTLNKDKLPLLDTSSVREGTALRRTTLVYRPSYANKGSPEKKLDLFSDLS